MQIAALVLLSLLSASSAVAQPAAPPQIVVSGDGVIKATPDQAWVSIGVESRAKVSKDAQQRNAQAMA